MDRPKLRNEAETIVVKVWDMALASVSPNADPEGYQIVRTNTLEWARDAILALIPDRQDKPPVLSDEKYMKLVKYIPCPEHDLRKVAQAMWDIWNKWYEGG